MKKLFALALCVVSFAAVAAPASYVSFKGKLDKNIASFVYMNQFTPSSNGEVWASTRTRLTAARTFNGKKYDAVDETRVYDCKNRTVAVATILMYHSNAGSTAAAAASRQFIPQYDSRHWTWEELNEQNAFVFAAACKM